MKGPRYIVKDSIQEKFRDREYEYHLKKVIDINETSMVGKSKIKEDNFFDNFREQKKKINRISQEEKQKDISRSNDKVVKKIISIGKKPHLIHVDQTQNAVSAPKSLNSKFKKYEEERIAKENVNLARRIYFQNSSLSKDKMNKEIEKYLNLRKHMSKYNYFPNPIKAPSILPPVQEESQEKSKIERHPHDCKIEKLSQPNNVDSSLLKNSELVGTPGTKQDKENGLIFNREKLQEKSTEFLKHKLEALQNKYNKKTNSVHSTPPGQSKKAAPIKKPKEPKGGNKKPLKDEKEQGRNSNQITNEDEYEDKFESLEDSPQQKREKIDNKIDNFEYKANTNSQPVSKIESQPEEKKLVNFFNKKNNDAPNKGQQKQNLEEDVDEEIINDNKKKKDVGGLEEDIDDFEEEEV